MSNTLTNLCIALLNFSLFCFVLHGFASVQYCNVKTIQYNTSINLSEYGTTLMSQDSAHYHWKGFCSEKLDKENKKDPANLTIRANTFTAFPRLRGITTSIAFK